LTKKALYMRE